MDLNEENSRKGQHGKAVSTTNRLFQTLGVDFPIVPIHLEKLSQKSQKTLINGPEFSRKEIYERPMNAFMFDGKYKKYWGWLGAQDIDKKPSDSSQNFKTLHLLAKRMKIFQLKPLPNLIAEKLENLSPDCPIADLREWALRFSAEILGEQVFKVNILPNETASFLHEVEDTIINKAQPYKLFGRELALSPAQQEFVKVRENFEEFARAILNRNKDHILKETGYIKDLLLFFAEEFYPDEPVGDGNELDLDLLSEIFEREDIQTNLALGLRLLINSGNVHLGLVGALLNFTEEKMLELQQSEDKQQFIKKYVSSSLIHFTPLGHTARLCKEAAELKTIDEGVIPVQKNTIVFLQFRRLAEEKAKPKLFLEGLPRACPGETFTKKFIGEILLYLASNNLFVQLDDTEQSKISDAHWTVKGAITEPKPGVKIGFKFASLAEKNEDEKMVCVTHG